MSEQTDIKGHPFNAESLWEVVKRRQLHRNPPMFLGTIGRYRLEVQEGAKDRRRIVRIEVHLSGTPGIREPGGTPEYLVFKMLDLYFDFGSLDLQPERQEGCNLEARTKVTDQAVKVVGILIQELTEDAGCFEIASNKFRQNEDPAFELLAPGESHGDCTIPAFEWKPTDADCKRLKAHSRCQEEGCCSDRFFLAPSLSETLATSATDHSLRNSVPTSRLFNQLAWHPAPGQGDRCFIRNSKGVACFRIQLYAAQRVVSLLVVPDRDLFSSLIIYRYRKCPSYLIQPKAPSISLPPPSLSSAFLIFTPVLALILDGPAASELLPLDVTRRAGQSDSFSGCCHSVFGG